jgi:hypothetical protein
LVAVGVAVLLLASCKKQPPAATDESDCMPAAESITNAKPHRNAAPPFTDCAAGVFAHCGGKEGERGGLCSRPLDIDKTAAARKQKPDSCCYRPAD